MTDDLEWINNKVPFWKHAVKPCKIREFCLYGSLVEMFPLQDHRRNKMSCSEFGHDCPVFYLAEIFIERPLVT
ncbi:MAG: endonuclease [Deltaproteobacteria bacterium]|nr:endonuclease [Deltaproteobacteria bacterium]